MKRQGWLNRAYCDLHVAKLADSTEAASFLPKVADSLVAHGSLTVSEWAAVTLFSKKNKKTSSLSLLSLQISFKTKDESAECIRGLWSYFRAGRVVEEVAVVSMVGHSNT